MQSDDNQNQDIFFNNQKEDNSPVELFHELQRRYGQFNNGPAPELEEDKRVLEEDYQELDLSSSEEEEILTPEEPEKKNPEFFNSLDKEEDYPGEIKEEGGAEEPAEQEKREQEEFGPFGVREKEAEKEETGIYLSPQKIALIKKFLGNVKDNNDKLLALFKDWDKDFEIRENNHSSTQVQNNKEAEEGEIIEGVFDGENMIGPDGQQYTVPTNYASKSKLVEGDILKLTILPDGSFIYKQISPIARERVTGELKETEEGSFYVVSGDKKWRVLLASVTYFKGESGDEVVLLIPKEEGSKWGAIENIIKK